MMDSRILSAGSDSESAFKASSAAVFRDSQQRRTSLGTSQAIVDGKAEALPTPPKTSFNSPDEGKGDGKLPIRTKMERHGEDMNRGVPLLDYEALQQGRSRTRQPTFGTLGSPFIPRLIPRNTVNGTINSNIGRPVSSQQAYYSQDIPRASVSPDFRPSQDYQTTQPICSGGDFYNYNELPPSQNQEFFAEEYIARPLESGQPRVQYPYTPQLPHRQLLPEQPLQLRFGSQHHQQANPQHSPPSFDEPPMYPNMRSVQEGEQDYGQLDDQQPYQHQNHHQPYISPPSGNSNQANIPTQGPQQHAPSAQPSKIHRPTPTRKHKCPVCDRLFLRPSSLAVHMRTHTGERPFPCPFPDCLRYQPGEGFSVESNRTRHCKTCHEGRELP
jgi:hypothetical protein